MAELLGLACQGATLFDQCAQSVPGDIAAAAGKLPPDSVKIVAKRAEVIHDECSRKRLESSIEVGVSQSIAL
jgi:hypothetical protein